MAGLPKRLLRAREASVTGFNACRRKNTTASTNSSVANGRTTRRTKRFNGLLPMGLLLFLAPIRCPPSYALCSIIDYSPECVEGEFSEGRQKNPLACDRYSHTANGEPQAWLLYLLAPLRRPPKRLPGAPGTPIAGSIQQSRPHQPATRQARTSRMATMAISGLAPAVPANRKLAFMKTPKKAAMPVKAPRTRANPIMEIGRASCRERV